MASEKVAVAATHELTSPAHLLELGGNRDVLIRRAGRSVDNEPVQIVAPVYFAAASRQ